MKHALVALLMTASPACASDLCPLVQRLNVEIATLTDYRPTTCPAIGFSQLPADTGLRSQAGAYFPDTGAIELAPDLDMSTALGQSYLLHELIHAAQYAAGAEKRAPCQAWLEAEAYSAQADFLRRHGQGEQALMISLLAMQLGSCGMLAES